MTNWKPKKKKMKKPIIRHFSDPIIWTHVLLFVNVVFYAYKSFFVIAGVMMINVVFSFLYHWTRETDEACGELDRVFCLVSLSTICWQLVQYCSILQMGLCLIWLLLSLCILEIGKHRDYSLFHSLWHFMVFGGNVIAWSYLPNL